MPLTMTKRGETELVVTRHFAAPPATVYTAFTDAELVRQWMLGPPGWAITHIVYDAVPDGRIEIRWQSDKGQLNLTGRFIDLKAPHRIVHEEQFHMPDPMPLNRITTTFDPDGAGCLLTVVMRVDTPEIRQAMLDSGMAGGMEQSYARLDGLVAP